MKVTFLGASEQVTGSCYLLESEQARVLIDCGMFQGTSESSHSNSEPFDFDPKTIDAVLVTHAHLDHCGRIPKLVKEGFTGRVIATEPTLELGALIMEDAVHIMAEKAEETGEPPIYLPEHVTQTIELFEPHTYHDDVTVNDMKVEFFDAGHILGSSSIRITSGGRSIVFSGDLGNPPVPLLYPTEFIHEADAVVMETTYGARIHETLHERELMLKSAIYETVAMKGVLMIPAFALERTQELLYEINEMVQAKDIPSVPMYLDSPLAIRATEVFRKYKQYLNEETQKKMSVDDIFAFPGLTMTAQVGESKAINHAPAPKIIIAGSGMADGGRIVHHITRYIENEQNQYLIIGYQVEGTLGRSILDGEKEIFVGGKKYDVRAKVQAIGGYSAHADRNKLKNWITQFDIKKLKHLFLTHGELTQATELKRHLGQSMHMPIDIPKVGQSFEI